MFTDMKAINNSQVEVIEGVTNLSIQDYLTFVRIMEAEGVASTEDLERAEANYPYDYDGPVVSIGVSTELFLKAAAIHQTDEAAEQAAAEFAQQ